MRGWLLASVDGQKTGLIPANYIKILGKRRGRKTVVVSQPSPSSANQVAVTFANPAEQIQDSSQVAAQPQSQANGFSAAMDAVFSSDSVQPTDNLYENALQQSLLPATSAAPVKDLKEASEILEASSNTTSDQ